jgi:hypothetical protein
VEDVRGAAEGFESLGAEERVGVGEDGDHRARASSKL